MKKPYKPDLSSAYGDRDETLSWPALILVILYSLTVGWILVLAHSIILLFARSTPTVTKSPKAPRGGRTIELLRLARGRLSFRMHARR